MASAKSKFYFNTERELTLLTEVSQVDPFTNEHPDATWESVTEHLNFIFHSNNPGLEADLTPRTVRDKVDRMLKQFRANDNRKIRKSGTEEELTEKLTLLQEISDKEEEGKRLVRKCKEEQAAAEKARATQQEKVDARLAAFRAARPFNGDDNKNKKGKAPSGDSDIEMAEENSGDDAAAASTSTGMKSKCMTGAQHLSKMMDSFDKWAETEGAVQKYKIDKEHELQQMRMKLKHEREMAKIKFNSEKLSLEREKMALYREQLRAEAAAHGQDPSSFPSGKGDGESDVQNGNDFDARMYEFDD